VKIRGFRIEPGEVEVHLRALPGIAAAVVVPRRESTEVHFLAAYVVPEPGVELDGAGVRASLRARLPEHLVPTTVSVLASLPLTPNGKVDRDRLPDPRPAGAASPGSRPGGTTEAAIAGIWARVLRIPVESLGTDEDFFDLGGHSLLLTQVASRLRAELEVEVPLHLLFRTRTLRELGALVDGWERTPASAIPVVDRAEYRGTLDDEGRLTVPPALRERLRREAAA
jgi:acyl carrier protein